MLSAGVRRQSGCSGRVARVADVCLVLVRLCAVGIQSVNQDK